MNEKKHRPLSNIAHDIRRDWEKVSYAARPYLSAMAELDQIENTYMYDSGKSIVRYFLCNAGAWRGPVAQTIKAELKELLK
jgi:hypothetical protein